jgi:exopolysaccharide production protein ExoQ
MRLIALTICIIFILYILRMDAKRNPNVSYELWLPWVWFAIFGSRAVSYWFGVGIATDSPDYYLEGSPFDRNVFIVLIIIGIFILIKRKVNLPSILRNNKFIFLYIFYLLLSVLWSDYTLVSFKRWIKELGNLVMILIILTEQHPLEATKTIIKRLAYVLVPLSILFNRYFPEISRMYNEVGNQSFTGISTNKNSLGALCMVCGLFLFWNLLTLWHTRKENKNTLDMLVHLLYLVMIASLLHTADSATAIFTAIIGIFIIIGLNLKNIKKNVKTFKYYLLFFVIILSLAGLAFDLKSLTISSLGRNETLTGRTQIWEDVLKMENNPMFGSGYESFWLGERAEYFWDKYKMNVNQAHNGYLEIYLNLGFIGLMLITLILFSVCRNISMNLLDRNNYDYQALRMALVVVFLFANITEAYFKGPMWLFFLLVAVVTPDLQERKI